MRAPDRILRARVAALARGAKTHKNQFATVDLARKRLALLLVALYAASDEFHQLFVSSRDAPCMTCSLTPPVARQVCSRFGLLAAGETLVSIHHETSVRRRRFLLRHRPVAGRNFSTAARRAFCRFVSRSHPRLPRRLVSAKQCEDGSGAKAVLVLEKLRPLLLWLLIALPAGRISPAGRPWFHPTTCARCSAIPTPS